MNELFYPEASLVGVFGKHSIKLQKYRVRRKGHPDITFSFSQDLLEGQSVFVLKATSGFIIWCCQSDGREITLGVSMVKTSGD